MDRLHAIKDVIRRWLTRAECSSYLWFAPAQGLAAVFVCVLRQPLLTGAAIALSCVLAHSRAQRRRAEVSCPGFHEGIAASRGLCMVFVAIIHSYCWHVDPLQRIQP